MKKLVVLATLLAAAFAHAETKTFTGSANNFWTSNDNWNPTGVPGPNDDAVIDGKEVSAYQVRINVGSLTVTGEGASLNTGWYSDSQPSICDLITVSNDLTVANGATLNVYAFPLTDRNVFSDQTTATAALYTNATIVSVGGTFAVTGGSCVYPNNHKYTGTPVFFKVGNFNLSADSEINVVNRGWQWLKVSSTTTEWPYSKLQIYSSTQYYRTYAFGAGVEYGNGGGYGGKPLTTATVTYETPNWKSGQTYGNAYAPFLSGSPSGIWGGQWSIASGTIAVFATNAVTVAGTLNASGKPNMSYTFLSGTSGGSIWICGKTVELTSTSHIEAKGGNCRATYSRAGGGGGRIAVGVGLSQADIDMLAALGTGDEPSATDYFIQTLTSSGYISVDGGCDSASVYGNPGTLKYIESMAGKAIITTAGDPVNAISDGVTYGSALVDCTKELTYTAGAIGRDPANPTGVAYPCEGWRVTNAGGTVASGETTTAKFTLDPTEGPFTLTWLWGEASSTRAFVIDRAGGGTITANGTTYSEDFLLPVVSSETTDTLIATPNDGYRFLGWVGLANGFSAATEVTAAVEAGGSITALFEPIAGATYETKTWAGSSSNNNWDDASNWIPTGVPTLKSDVVIADSDCAAVSGIIVHSLTVNEGRKLWVSASGEFVTKTDSKTTITEPTAVTTDTKKHRFVFVNGDVTLTDATVAFGGAGANYTNFAITVNGNLTLNGETYFSVSAAPMDETLASTPTNLYHAATPFTVGGDMTLNDTSAIYPWCDKYTGTAVRFTVTSNMTVAAGATIDASGRGWYWRIATDDGDPYRVFAEHYQSGTGTEPLWETRAFGAGKGYDCGGGYGNYGNWNSWQPHKTNGHPYWVPEAPYLPGSPNGLYSYSNYPADAGGGVVWITCGRKITLNGTIAADGGEVVGFYGGAAGGSVWLLARGMAASPTALLSAHGGRSAPTQRYTSAGSGGRVSVALGVSDAEAASLAMAEKPDTLEYADTIDLATVNVSGGAEGTGGGAIAQRYAPTGTVSFVRGANADKSMTVTANVSAGDPSPAYGISPQMAGDVITLSATDDSDGYGADPTNPDTMRWHCAGYVISNATSQIASGNATSFDFEMPDENVTVTWIWENRQCQVSATNPQGATYGSLLFNGSAYESGTSVWMTLGSTYTLTAVPADGYEFLYWAGDFPYGKARTNPVTMTVAAGQTVRPVFRRAEEPTTRIWQKKGVAEGNFLDESNWSGGNIPGTGDTVVIPGGICLARDNNYVEVGALVVSNETTRFAVGSTAGLVNNTSPTYDIIETTDNNPYATTVSALADEIALIVHGDILIANSAQVGVGAPKAMRAAHGRLEAANVTVTNSAQLMVSAGAVDDRFSFASGAGFVKVTGAFNIQDTAVFRPVSDGLTGGSVKTTAATFSLAAGAQVRAVAAGFMRVFVNGKQDDSSNYSFGIGQGYSCSAGAGYGGHGDYDTASAESLMRALVYGIAYGFERAPIHPGSPNGWYNSPYMAGGGLVRIHVTGTMTVLGDIIAHAQERTWTETYFFGGASGGGVWLTAHDFVFGDDVLIDVHGGYSTYDSAGGGGRVAIACVQDADAIDAFATLGKANGYMPMKDGQFAADFPGVTVNVAGGKEYTKGSTHTELEGHTGDDGTFCYLLKCGLMFLLK